MSAKRGEKGGFWPTPIQELLLRASLLEGRDCVDAWQTWKRSVAVDNLDLGSQRLLPLLYRNLVDHCVSDPLLTTLKNAYRRTWRDNQLLFHEVSKILRALDASGIRTIVIKGAALALLYYKDAAIRPMNDFDLMIPERQRSAAIAVMRDLGWTPMPRSPEALTEGYLSIVNSHGFTHRSGRECDLHWHLFPECCRPDDDRDFWDGAVPFEIRDVPTLSLSPTDHLLHICIHGAEWNPIPPIRWIADAAMIMKRSSIDWDRIVAQARKRRLTIILTATLDYLAAQYKAPVPAEIVQSLRNTQVSRMEIAEYRYKKRNYEAEALGFLPLLWFKIGRASCRERV